ncbi:MAG TPA: hypothetical protein EYP65_08220, partial [Armatimonadetes bacterium]|nr:hypothetical protein [Armatimonadota bacterium]
MLGVALASLLMAGWAWMGGEWREVEGGVVGRSEGEQAFAWPRGAPKGGSLRFEATVVVRRIVGFGWKLGGICVYLDRWNFWRLALVEGPEGERYVEFVEMLRGRWQAQDAPGTRLERKAEGGKLRWELGRPYKLRVSLDFSGISGEVLDPRSGRLLLRIAYRFDEREAVFTGRPALSVVGMEAEFRAIRWEVSPMEGGAERSLKAALVFEGEVLGPGSADPGRLAEILSEAGFEVKRVDFGALLRPGALDEFDLIALPYGPAFPAEARGAFLRFLQRGGGLISFGSLPFIRPMWHRFGKWLTFEEVMREVERRARREVRVFLDFEGDDLSGWQRATGNPKAKSKVEVSSPGAEGSGRCLKLVIR